MCSSPKCWQWTDEKKSKPAGEYREYKHPAFDDLLYWKMLDSVWSEYLSETAIWRVKVVMWQSKQIRETSQLPSVPISETLLLFLGFWQPVQSTFTAVICLTHHQSTEPLNPLILELRWKLGSADKRFLLMNNHIWLHSKATFDDSNQCTYPCKGNDQECDCFLASDWQEARFPPAQVPFLCILSAGSMTTLQLSNGEVPMFLLSHQGMMNVTVRHGKVGDWRRGQ